MKASILSGSSLIGHEFKWDLIDYLAATPDAQVGSLQDILDAGLYHVRLEATFRRRAEAAVPAPARVTIECPSDEMAMS